MAELSDLMKLPSALAAFEFSDQGELVAHEISDGQENLNETVLDLLSHVCVANMSIATMQARGWEKVTGMGGFYPIGGFGLMGVDWSAVVHDHKGVVLHNDGADFQAAYDALGQ